MSRLARLPNALLVEVSDTPGEWRPVEGPAYVDVSNARAIFAEGDRVIVAFDYREFRYTMRTASDAAMGADQLATIGASG